MSLLQLRDYLQQRGRSRLSDIATYFNTQPDAVQFALGEWEKRGKVRNLQSGCSTEKCGGGCCSSAAPEPVYEWVLDAAAGVGLVRM